MANVIRSAIQPLKEPQQDGAHVGDEDNGNGDWADPQADFPPAWSRELPSEIIARRRGLPPAGPPTGLEEPHRADPPDEGQDEFARLEEAARLVQSSAE